MVVGVLPSEGGEILLECAQARGGVFGRGSRSIPRRGKSCVGLVPQGLFEIVERFLTRLQLNAPSRKLVLEVLRGHRELPDVFWQRALVRGTEFRELPLAFLELGSLGGRCPLEEVRCLTLPPELLVTRDLHEEIGVGVSDLLEEFGALPVGLEEHEITEELEIEYALDTRDRPLIGLLVLAKRRV